MAGFKSSPAALFFTFHLTAATIEDKDAVTKRTLKKTLHKPTTRMDLTLSLKNVRSMSRNTHWASVPHGSHFEMVFVMLIYEGVKNLERLDLNCLSRKSHPDAWLSGYDIGYSRQSIRVQYDMTECTQVRILDLRFKKQSDCAQAIKRLLSLGLKCQPLDLNPACLGMPAISMHAEMNQNLAYRPSFATPTATSSSCSLPMLSTTSFSPPSSQYQTGSLVETGTSPCFTRGPAFPSPGSTLPVQYPVSNLWRLEPPAQTHMVHNAHTTFQEPLHLIPEYRDGFLDYHMPSQTAKGTMHSALSTYVGVGSLRKHDALPAFQCPQPHNVMRNQQAPLKPRALNAIECSRPAPMSPASSTALGCSSLFVTSPARPSGKANLTGSPYLPPDADFRASMPPRRLLPFAKTLMPESENPRRRNGGELMSDTVDSMRQKTKQTLTAEVPSQTRVTRNSSISPPKQDDTNARYAEAPENSSPIVANAAGSQPDVKKTMVSRMTSTTGLGNSTSPSQFVQLCATQTERIEVKPTYREPPLFQVLEQLLTDYQNLINASCETYDDLISKGQDKNTAVRDAATRYDVARRQLLSDATQSYGQDLVNFVQHQLASVCDLSEETQEAGRPRLSQRSRKVTW